MSSSNGVSAQSTAVEAAEPAARRYEAARLYTAELKNAAELCIFFNTVDPGSCAGDANMAVWIASGGALVVMNDARQVVSAVRWRECDDAYEGWEVWHTVTLEPYRGRGYGRWLMTKLEALAIQNNIANLHVFLPADHVHMQPYYARMGYIQSEDKYQRDKQTGGVHVYKAVGGRWQVHR